MHRRFSAAIVFVFGASAFTGVAAQPSKTSASTSATSSSKSGARAETPRPSNFLPGTRTNVLTTIQGNALSSTNGVLANATVRLRNARTGRIVDVKTTDKTGLFTFESVDPGSYIVELVGTDQTIWAASQILNVNAGEAVSAIVKLPFRIPPFGGLLGHSAASAATVASIAAAAGVLTTEVTGDPVSPQR